MQVQTFPNDWDIKRGVHKFVCGRTGSGKTYWVREMLKRTDLPVFFFNPQREAMPFTKVHKASSMDDIIRHLRKGGKIDYIPSINKKFAKVELNYISQDFFKYGGFSENNPLIFAIDECHLYAKQGQNNEYIEMIATSGRVFGFKGVFISQRPALVDKTLVTQSETHIIFATEWENEYFKSKGIDSEYINKTLNEAGEHSFVIYEKGKISPAYKI